MNVAHKPPFYCPATVDPNLLGIKRKKQYDTWQDAHAADPLCKVYKCRHCGKYHLATKRKQL